MRVFPIDIEQIISCALIQGVARAGVGLDQKAVCSEKLDSSIVRMVCAQGCAHSLYQDHCLAFKCENESVESVTDSHCVNLNTNNSGKNDKKSD